MGLWSKLKSIFLKKEDEIRGIVMLLTEPRLLDPQNVERALESMGTPAKVIETDDGWLAVPALFVSILYAPKPYVPPGMSKERLAVTIWELRLRDAFVRHEAFVSVHQSAAIPEAMKPVAKESVNKLVAALTDDTTVLLWDTSTNRMSIPTEEVVAALAAGDDSAFETITWDAITLRDSEDDAIDKAIAEARERFPEFRAAYSKGGFEAAMVKAPFPARDGEPEHMWFDVTAIEGDTIKGKLVNKPRNVDGLKLGSEVSVSAAELSDWMFVGEEGLLGGFVERVLRAG